MVYVLCEMKLNMGLLTGLLSTTLCVIGTGVAGTAVGVPTGSVGLMYTLYTGFAVCEPIAAAATACPLLP